MGIFNRKNKTLTLDTQSQEIISQLIATSQETIPVGDLDYLCKFNNWISASIRIINQNCIRPKLIIKDIKTNEDVSNKYSSYINMFKNPNKFMNYTEWLQYNVTQYIVYGRCINKKIKIGDNVKALLPIDTKDISISVIGGEAEYLFNGENLNIDDIIDWKDTTYSVGYVDVISKIQNLAYQILTENKMNLYNYSYFKNSAMPSGILSTLNKLSKDELIRLKEDWKSFSGSENSGKTPVLHSGLTYQQLANTMKDMLFDSLKNITKEEIISIMGIPPVYLGLTADINRSNAETQRKIFWENVIIPILTDLVQSLNEILPDNLKNIITFDYDYSNISELREDLSETLVIAQSAYMLGYSLESITDALNIPFEIDNSEEDISTKMKKIYLNKFYGNK